MPPYRLTCLSCLTPYEITAPDMSAALQAGRAADHTCPACITERVLALGPTDAADHATHTAFLRARDLSPLALTVVVLVVCGGWPYLL